MNEEKSSECAATILEIQGVINSIMNLERQASRKMLLKQHVDMDQKHLEHFLDLSARAQEMQVAFSDLLKTQSAASTSKDQHPSSFVKMVSLFSKSAVVQDLHYEFQQLDNWSANAAKSATKVMNAVSFFEQHVQAGGSSGHGDDGAGASTVASIASAASTRNQTFFQDIYTSFSSELQHVADLENRLRSRDQYLQDTITETAKRCHSLEQTIAELQSENEDLKNDYLNLEARMQMQPARDVAAGAGVGASKGTPSTSTASMRAQQLEASKGEKHEKEEREVSRWILELTNTDHDASVPSTQSQNRRKSVAERQDHKDTEELIKLTQNLTTLAEEKELLEHDLTLVRLQVEHLEAISKERDAIIADFMNRKSAPPLAPLTPISPVPLQVDVGGGDGGKRMSAVPSIRSPLSPTRINSLSPMNRQSLLGLGWTGV